MTVSLVRGGRRALTLLVAIAVLAAGACSDDSGSASGSATGSASTHDVLTTVADQVVIPSYRALVTDLGALDTALATLCTAPASPALEAARAAWRDADLAWQSTRPSDVGPAIDRRLMGAVGFMARPAEVEALLAGPGGVDPGTLGAAGSGVRGLFAVEVALFAPGASALAGPGPAGTRRCTYARSAVQLSQAASKQVLDDWTGGYRDTFVKGMDGNPQTSVEALVNELTFRLQEIDDQGLRTLAAATSYAALPASHQEGGAAFGLAELKALLDGVAVVVEGTVDGPGLSSLVRSHSATTADQLASLAQRSVGAVKVLPDSLASGLQARARLRRADRDVAALKVLLSTTVASQLGVTIGFSDADGDS